VINKPKILNLKPYAPSDVNELVILPGVKEAIGEIRQMGFEIVVVTNQPEISRGTTNPSTVKQINNEISRQTGIDYFRVCPHDDSDKCACRKPRPGLILKAAEELDIDLKQSYLVGDRWRDIEAGNSAGCKCFFIDYEYDERKPQGNFVTVCSLAEAINQIRNSYDSEHQ
jgi:D-glycero-D-manno-heptose 1,7-bisphosphate phosphatase